MNPITATYGYTGSIQTYNVTVTGSYTLDVRGASGGNSTATDGSLFFFGALGASVTASFQFAAGDRLLIQTGQVGGTANNGGSGGGGGGSFVYLDSDGVQGLSAGDRLLLAAGGGGGGGRSGTGNPGISPDDPGGSGSGAGGVGGSGGSNNGGGGAGINGGGGNGTGAFSGSGAPSVQSRGDGAATQFGATPGGGGYGGGGGAGFIGGGGGGGYTGGVGGTFGGNTSGGGGRSYIDTQATSSASQTGGAARGDGLVTVTCYVTGTGIRIFRDGAEADVAVEHLRVGDLAVTVSGAHRPIRWIGSRLTDCRRHPRPAEAMPVRIRTRALGEGRPARDLVVSPGHAICLDVLGEVLIPAAALVNGTTITQQDVDSVTYWHVELDSHDILIAEGQPAESYLDMGNRGFFSESGVVDLDATPDADAAARTHADFCRPYHADGVVLDAVRAQIQARAERRGWRLDAAPWADMHLMVDGVRVDADTHGLSARFVLPASAQDVWLVSETSVPREVGFGADARRLGLCLQAITIDDGIGGARSVALDDPRLCVGFHDCEDGVRRWTAGCSRFPAALFAGCRGTVFLRFDLAAPALPRWIAPGVESIAMLPEAWAA